MGDILFGKERVKIFFNAETGMLESVTYQNNHVTLNSRLWQVEAKKSEGTRSFSIKDMSGFKFEQEEHYLDLLWESALFSVRVSLRLENEAVKWRISVQSHSNEYFINKIMFPIIGCIKPISEEGENDYLMLPWQNGWLIKNPIHTLLSKKSGVPFWMGRGGRKYENEYPAQYSYQFAAYYSPGRYGYYLSTEDSEVYIKTMGFYFDEDSGGFNFAITNYPENMGLTKYYCMPYAFVLDFFAGDWQNAANMYRRWAVKQKWCLERLKDKYLPENVKNIDLWRINHTNYALGTRTQEYFDTSVRLKNELCCNIALHWYGWNMAREHGFNYPEMLDRGNEKWHTELTAWNKKFSKEGIVKLPYVNVHLWDSFLESWESENARETVLKDEAGQLLEEPWIEGRLKPVCHTTPKIMNKAMDLFTALLSKKEFDGLYIDQVASYNAALCFDTGHPHPAGGGKWWNESYHTMLNTLRNISGNEKVLTTESCCESYIDVFDLFLILDTNFQTNAFCEAVGGENCESIPLFSMIYGDYALSYGSICRFKDTLDVFEFNFVRNILWGILPTVEGAELSELDGEKACGYMEVLKRGVDFYKENKELILYGRLKEIPVYECEGMEIGWHVKNGESYTKKYPRVIAAVWEDKEGQNKCMVYNFDDKALMVGIKGRDICIPAKAFKVDFL